MTEHVAANVVIVDMSIYWLMTIILLSLMDFFAKRKLGKASLGFKALRIPKFIALLSSSAVTILLMAITVAGANVSQGLLTYFGIPYFAIWVFYMCCVFKRVKAEKTRRIR